MRGSGVIMTLSTPTGSHAREHRSVLADIEKRALVWMAARLPQWVSSDQLTALGAVAMAAAGGAFAAASISRWSLALVPLFLAVNWFGDSLDGTLARVRNAQRPRYGFYIDHVVDVVNTVALFAGLAVSGIVSPWIAAGLLVAYLMLCAESFLAAHTLAVFRISFSGFGPTELRILLAIGAIAAIERPLVQVFGLGRFHLFDVGGLIGIAGMLFAFAVSAASNARALDRAEPLPRAVR